VKTARFVLSRHSVGTSLLEMTLSARMSAFSFAGFPRCAFTLSRIITAHLVVRVWSSLIASRKMSGSGAPTHAFPPPPTQFFTTFSNDGLCHRGAT